MARPGVPTRVFFLLAFLSVSTASCSPSQVRPSARTSPVCAAGYSPSDLGERCVDMFGRPQPDGAVSGLAPVPTDPEESLGSYFGSCGDQDCLFSLVRGSDQNVVAVLQRRGREELRLSPIRFSGNRATGTAQDGETQNRVELQFRDGNIYGTWTVTTQGAREETGHDLQIRFVVRRSEESGDHPGLRVHPVR